MMATRSYGGVRGLNGRPQMISCLDALAGSPILTYGTTPGKSRAYDFRHSPGNPGSRRVLGSADA